MGWTTFTVVFKCIADTSKILYITCDETCSSKGMKGKRKKCQMFNESAGLSSDMLGSQPRVNGSKIWQFCLEMAHKCKVS